MQPTTRLFAILAALVAVLAGCAKTSDIENLQNQIDALKSNQIQSISGQISSIQTSLTSLQSTDKELQGYISTLQSQAAALEKTGAELETAIANLKAELKDEISTVEADCLAQLSAYKTAVDSEIASLKTSIAVLQAKDEDLQKQIDALRTYIDKGITDTKDWVSATFATLDQYNATAEIVASIRTQIEGVNADIAALKQSGKADLDAAIGGLRTDLQDQIKTAADNAASALAAAVEEITAAYTSAIANAISASETSMKSWVNEQLTGYYTAAQMDGKLSSLKTSLESQLGTQKTYLEGLIASLETSTNSKISSNTQLIEQLRSDLDAAISSNSQAISDISAAITQLRDDLATQKTEITAAYKTAIESAINTLEGKIKGDVATEVWIINSRIDREIWNVNDKITALADRVSACESDIASIKSTLSDIQKAIKEIQDQLSALLGRIQSITYVPRYSDGKAVMTYTDDSGTLTAGKAVFDFELSPASAAAELAALWNSSTGSSVFTMKAVYTITRAVPESVDLSIESVTAEDSYLTVTVSGSTLKEEFFRGGCSANASLKISDGVNDLTTAFVEMLPMKNIVFSDAGFKNYCVTNFDTDGDGEISPYEAWFVTSIECSDSGLTSLEGIQFFSNLEYLDVSGNTLLSRLDVSKNTALASLDVSNNTSLASLVVSETVKLIVSAGLKSSIYHFGQYVSIDGVTGIVYKTSSPAIFSTDETSASWSAGKTWCTSKGSAWSMPSEEELKLISNNYWTLNSVLSSIGAAEFATTQYWSSTELGSVDPGAATVITLSDGSYQSEDKNYAYLVRAVRAL